jgi:hypothetical protein
MPSLAMELAGEESKPDDTGAGETKVDSDRRSSRSFVCKVGTLFLEVTS